MTATPTPIRCRAVVYRCTRLHPSGARLPQRLEYATMMRIRIVLGCILSVSIVGCALLRSASLRRSAVQFAVEVKLPADEDVGPVVADMASASAAIAARPTTSASTLDPAYLRAAGICPGLDPAVLAAIHTIETHKGIDRRVSAAGAVGPMQFL